MTSRFALLLAFVALATAASAAERIDFNSVPVDTLLAGLDALHHAGHYAEAESIAAAADPAIVSRFGGESLERARLLYRWSASRMSGGRSDDSCLAAARHALKIQKSELPDTAVAIITSLRNIGDILDDRADFDGAEASYQEALRLAEKKEGAESLRVASILTDIGLEYWRRGEYEEAHPWYERSIAIREKKLGPDDPSMAAPLINLGILFWQTGRFPEALELEERGLHLREKSLGPDHPDVASSLNNVALVLDSMADYPGARDAYLRALAIQEKRLGPEHPNVATILQNLGNTCSNMGDHRAAMEYLERALAIRTKALGPDHPLTGTALHNLGTAEVAAGHDAAGVEWYRKALDVRGRALGPDHPRVAETRGAIANRLAAQGDTAAAAAGFRECLAIYDKSVDRDDPERCHYELDLAQTLSESGGLDEAEKLTRHVLEARRRRLGDRHPEVGETLRTAAEIKRLRGDADGALRDYLAADEIDREQCRRVVRHSGDRQALLAAADRSDALARGLGLLIPDFPGSGRRDAWDALIRSRALAIDELASRNQNDSGDSLTMARRSEWRRLGGQLSGLILRGPGSGDPNAWKKQVDDLVARCDRLETELADSSAVVRADMARDRIGFSDVAAAIPPGSALVALGSAIDGLEKARALEYVAFVLRSGETSPGVVRLGSRAVIDSLVDSWRAEVLRGAGVRGAALSASEKRLRRIGNALRRAAWDPIEKRIAGVDRLFLVPDGSLQFVNFAALPDTANGYLVEHDPAFQLLSTERDLVPRPAVEATAFASLLVLGGVDYNATTGSMTSPVAFETTESRFRGVRSACAEFASLQFEPLPGARREAEDVARRWLDSRAPEARPTPPVIRLTGAGATEAAFKEAASHARYLHLATHGFVLGSECEVTASDARGVGGLVSPVSTAAAKPTASQQKPQPQSDQARALLDENPLVRSGLALAGANRRDQAPPGAEDGILTAQEIATLDLSGAEWVVLSACNSGTGARTSAEGVLGLRRAFEVAGAHSLLSSLWPVDDLATRHWMNLVYDSHFGHNIATIDAVREASRTMIREARGAGRATHPFYWGSFVASGEWR